MKIPISLLFVVLSSLIWSSVVSAQSSPEAVGHGYEAKTFVEVQQVGFFFGFNTRERTYTIRHDGYTESFSNTIQRRFFNLKMGQNGKVQRVYFLEHEGDLLLLYEVGNPQYGWGFLTRLDQTARVPRWVTPIKGYNIGPGLVEGNEAYFSSANVLGRIDLKTGRYFWKQVEFEQKYNPTIERFRLPIIAGDRIVFHEASDSGRVVEVDKTSGAMIAVKP